MKSRSIPWRFSTALLALACHACGSGGGSDASTDAARDVSTDVGPSCNTDRDCSDGVFCNGAELCAPGDPSADARGCVAPSQTACRATQTCDEAGGRCVTDCSVNADADGDGHRAQSCGGDDCDDSDVSRAPGRVEVCDARNHDEDCDPTTFGARDNDGDGFPDALCCNTDTTGAKHCGTDCNDMSALIGPTALEICNGADDNCNGMTDEGISRSFHRDADGDRFGSSDPAATMMACAAPAGYVEDHTDCNDAAPGQNPGAPEVCDGVDNDCDGMTDEGLSHTYYQDSDGDLFGAAAKSMTACATPPGYVENNTDCDDNHASVHPGAAEICDGLDNGCNGGTDEGLARAFYRDSDGDGFGSTVPSDVSMACALPAGFVAISGDCNDAAPEVNPLATEVCNLIDDDCDGSVDEPPADSLCGGGLSGYACVYGSCTLSYCPAGRQDCNLDPTDGCETDTQGNPNFCGSCNVECGLGSVCTAGTCDTIVEVTTGSRHACARRSTGRVLCWGDDAVGEHGSGSAVFTRLPEQVAGIDDAVEIEAGTDFTCARHADGHVSCWGANGSGQLGSGSTVSSSLVPLRVAGINDAVAIDAGMAFACALRRSGEVWCWGANDRGQLGNNSTTPSSVPVQALVRSATAIATGGLHACALTPTNTLGALCWGDNTTGQLANGAPTPNDSLPHGYPQSTSGLPELTMISAGAMHTCARQADGGTTCWGEGSYGNLGTLSMPPYVPQTILWNAPLVSLAIGGNSGLGVDATGAAVGWGDNRSHQIDASGVMNTLPEPIYFGSGGVVSLSMSNTFACGVTSNNEVYCWGSNLDGQIGDGTTSDAPFPVHVPGISYTYTGPQ